MMKTIGIICISVMMVVMQAENVHLYLLIYCSNFKSLEMFNEMCSFTFWRRF